MSRLNIEFDGQWACFSTVVDDFITPFMSAEKYKEWRIKEYGVSVEPLEFASRLNLKEALFQLSLNKSDEEIIKV